MKQTKLSILAILLIPFLSCAQPGVEYKPTVRVGGIIADSVEADLDVLGYAISGDSEYSSVEVGIGTTTYKDGVRQSLAELVIAGSSYGDIDALEISGGGRFYLSPGNDFTPYLGVYSVSTIFEDEPITSVSPGVQLGVRVGLGAEYRISDKFFLDSSLRYLIPLVPAESESFPVVETEVSGMSLEIGIGLEF